MIDSKSAFVAFDVTQDDIDAVRHQPRSGILNPVEIAMLRYADVKWPFVGPHYARWEGREHTICVKWESHTVSWMNLYWQREWVQPFVAVGYIYALYSSRDGES